MKVNIHWHKMGNALASICGTLLLLTPLVTTGGLANGLVTGKLFWFHGVTALSAVVTIAIAACRRRQRFPFALPDGLLLAFAAVTLLTYDWTLDPEPEKLRFGGQLVVLWFLLRYWLANGRGLAFFFLAVLMLTGFVEAVWGWRQLAGDAYSHHALFRLTGSFFNPGPYSGFLAVVLPVCLWTALRFKRLTQYAGWIVIGAILVVLPAGMSRSAWLAAVVGCAWVGWCEGNGREKVATLYNRYKRFMLPLATVALCLLLFAFAGIYNLKRDSADGRLLMWKVTAQAIARTPLTGTGLGGFPVAYAASQADYFNGGEASEQEKRVAGCPEYAFNEYLQIGLEQGVVGLLLFLAWLGCLIRCGTRNGQHGAVGGLVALAVFALSSYPLQLPSFWVVLLLLGSICLVGEERETEPVFSVRYPVMSKCWLGLMALGSVCLFVRQGPMYEAYQTWERLQMLYHNKAYPSVVEDYRALHDRLRHKPEFLFEEAQCLSYTGAPAAAIDLLERAERLSGDPMIGYMIAKNLQATGHYAEAERKLLCAIQVLPERIYPYYLLAKLYAAPGFYQPDKLREAAQVVFKHKPKVENTATREMREEIKKLIDKNKIHL